MRRRSHGRTPIIGIVGALVLALTAPLGAQMVWSQIGLSGRCCHAVAYNAARQRVVLFGALSLTPGMQIRIGD